MSCVFCEKIANNDFDHEYAGCVVFEPLNPVVPGHKLVVPKDHAQSAAYDPMGASKAMYVAGLIVHDMTFFGNPPWATPQANIITSCGTDATQTIMHTHVHVIPRAPGDGLMLPWTNQEKQ